MNQRKVIPPVSPYRQKLHRIFVDALGDAISESRDMEHRPFFVTLHRPIPISLEIYMFPALNPPGGRNAHEYKINILLQGHKPGTRMSFPDNENYPILIAYAESFDVFIILMHMLIGILPRIPMCNSVMMSFFRLLFMAFLT